MGQLYPFNDPRAMPDGGPKVFVSGDGIRVTDDRGRSYIDAASALWCTSLGFSDQRLIDAAEAQMRQLPYYHSFMGRAPEPTERLARELADRLPGDLNRVFFATSGSEAVDTAVKLARFHFIGQGRPEKTLIIAREDAYHGSGTMSAALTAMAYCQDGFHLPTADVLRTGSTHYRVHRRVGETERQFSARRASELDQLIRSVGADRVCAFIGEPVIGSGGCIPPPDGYWEAIQAVLSHHDVLLIADEIITGFGRTGQWFGSETYDIRPDVMTLAKQLSGSYFPISAVAITDELYDSMADHAHRLGTLGHGFTYGGHPVGAAVALEALQIYDEMNLPHHVGRRAEWLTYELDPLTDFDEVVEVRQVGLMAGVELVPGMGAAVGAEAENRGVLFRVIGDTLAISPPLIVSREEIEEMVEVLVASVTSGPGEGFGPS